jgi:hypothetical protein
VQRFSSEEEFWDAFEAAYAALRADPDAWAEELAERALWDTTLMDGLWDDPYDDPRIADREGGTSIRP